MFFHIYKYRLKCIVRDKQMMFWTLLFPVLLSILFYMAFSNLTSGEAFSQISLAVVNDEAFQSDTSFKSVLDAVSTDGDNKLFKVQHTTSEQAMQLLEDGKVSGYIFIDNGPQLVVKNSGLNQTIIKSFLDNYIQTSSVISNIIGQNPTAIQNGLLDDIGVRVEFLKEKALSTAKPDTMLHFFYTLIGMAALFGSFHGVNEVTAIQANQSPQGARNNLTPTHKLKMFSISVLAAATVQYIVILILISFLILALGINFGNQLGFIALTCFIGTFTGVAFGSFISAVVTKNEGVKTGILAGSTMLMSFLSGMMSPDVKIIISNNVPILSYINPASLITDSFYALYYYETHTQYIKNTLILTGITVLLGVLTYFVLRRQKYASI